MKTILKICLSVLFFSFAFTSCATTVRIHPTHGVVVTKLHHPRVVVHKNVRYYRSGGMWYIKKRRGYVSVAPPAGIRITALPRGYRVVRVRGVRYYRYNGVYYRRAGRGYVVVNV